MKINLYIIKKEHIKYSFYFIIKLLLFIFFLLYNSKYTDFNLINQVLLYIYFIYF
ncbi:hypothetical protein CCP3SC1AL1_1140002 [Gammaproteobacteria bacterium]